MFSNSVINWQPFPGILIWVLVLNLFGNVVFPIALRLFLASYTRFVCSTDQQHEGQTLLTHSRHYFMLLFSSRQTWFLALFWLVLYSIMFFFFLGMQWNNAPLQGLSDGQKFVSALFQSMQLRNNGFNCQNLGSWSQAIFVFSLFFMYIGSYPEVIATRATVKTLESSGGLGSLGTRPTIVAISKSLALQSGGFILFIWLLILVVENQSWAGSQSITLLFELVSAFGVVGMSLGQPGTNYSFRFGNSSFFLFFH